MSAPQPSPRVKALLERTRLNRGRLIFALDATASREPTWDLAAQLTASMFEEAAKIGGLDVQLVYYRGDECRGGHWASDASGLAQTMRRIMCMAGQTQIGRVLRHIRTENEREKVSAAVFIGDAVEELPSKLYDAASGCPPLFLFQEGNGEAIYLDKPGGLSAPRGELVTVENVFRELARRTNGAYARFDAGAAARLGELLAAVAAFVVGGVAALGNLRTESARKLLGQMSK